MDFTTLLTIAQKNERHNKSKEIGGYKTELSVAKRESGQKHEKPRSPVVQKLIDEKRREKEMAEKKHKERQHEHRHKHSGEKREHSHKNTVENNNKKFTIPRKKETIDTLLKDLDSDDDDSDSVKDKTNKHDSSDRRESSNNNGVNKHRDHKSSKYKTDYSEHKGENHKSESRERDQSTKTHSSQSSSKSTSSSKHGEKSSHKDRETNSHKDRKPDSSSSKHGSSSKDRKPDSSSSSKHGSSSKDRKLDSSSSKHGSSGRDKEKQVKDSPVYKDNAIKSSNNHKAEKKKAKDLSLQELREQVKRMKDEEAMISKLEEKQSTEVATGDVQKQRTGLQGNEAEERKAKILSKTQMILERTKARLAAEQESKRQPRQKGRRSNEHKERSSGKDGDKVKSRSVIKDDYDSDDDEDPNTALDLSSNQELMRNESGDILKDIKKKIDAKLGDYNFPDKPMKERKERASASSVRRVASKIKSKSTSHMDRHMDRHRDKHKDKMRDRGKEKREKVKEMMRKDYKSSFSGDSNEQQKPRKPTFVRRFHQQQPPPMNFNDLLKIAEKKSKEKVPEINIIKPPKKKPEERLLTQEELDRRKRAEDVKRRREEEEARFQKGAPSANEQKTQPNSLKSKSDSSLLKGALTGKSAISSKSNANNMKQKTVSDKKGTKYDTENENVLVCKPSSSNVKKPRPVEAAPATNPWDRIYGQIQQRNPKAEKRKHAVLESSEEEDEYDEEDDFIDDGDCGEDYSAHIRNIFGYDKRKYKFEDEDDIDNMEANFTTIMKEEARSAKIGKMEDLEDIRREEEEERLKKLAKKKKRR